MKVTELVATVVGLVLLAGVLVSPVACTMNRQAMVAKAIQGGADPIAAKCAIEGDLAKEPMCLAAAMTHSKPQGGQGLELSHDRSH